MTDKKHGKKDSTLSLLRFEGILDILSIKCRSQFCI